jgi:hypothetical protein
VLSQDDLLLCCAPPVILKLALGLAEFGLTTTLSTQQLGAIMKVKLPPLALQPAGQSVVIFEVINTDVMHCAFDDEVIRTEKNAKTAKDKTILFFMALVG